MRKFIAALLLMTLSSIAAAQLMGNCEQPLAPGWNLVGASAHIPIQTLFAEPEKVVSVWEWDAEQKMWMLASPQLADFGQAFALSKGLLFLSGVKLHEGFWVNAAEPTTFNACIGHDAVPPSVPSW